MSLMLMFLGFILAGNDGYWFPWINLFGGFLMLIGATMVRGREA